VAATKGKSPKRKDRSMAELLPNGPLDIYEKYAGLTTREQVIVITALLDVALGELLYARLRLSDPEIVEFLIGYGADSGPLKGLANRARMCRALTVIMRPEMEAMLEIAKLRNVFAHRVEADILSPEINNLLQKANAHLKVHALGFYKVKPVPGITVEQYSAKYDAMAIRAKSDAKGAEELFRHVAMTAYSFIYFHQKHCDPVFFAMPDDAQQKHDQPGGTKVRVIKWKEIG
jgi:hypothetical protein